MMTVPVYIIDISYLTFVLQLDYIKLCLCVYMCVVSITFIIKHVKLPQLVNLSIILN